MLNSLKVNNSYVASVQTKSIALMGETICGTFDSVARSKYIADDGQIKQVGLDYTIGYFRVNETGRYFVSSPQNSHPILARFELDPLINEYLVGSIVVGPYVGRDYKEVLILEKGYYALCCNEVGSISDRFFVKQIINHNIKNVFYNVDYQISAERKKYINDSYEIDNAMTAYILYKLQLRTGLYYINTKKGLPYMHMHPILVKYTDSTFETNEVVVIDKNIGLVDDVYRLNEGYYAFCIQGSGDKNELADFIFLEDQSLTDNLYTDTSFNVAKTASMLSLRTSNNILTKITNGEYSSHEYIKDDGGIAVPSVVQYRLIRFQILNDGYYFIHCPYGNSHPQLAKYAPNWLSCQNIIINTTSRYICDVLYLEEGYYALCYNYYGYDDVYNPQEVYVSKVSEDHTFQSLNKKDLTLLGTAQMVSNNIKIGGNNSAYARVSASEFNCYHYTMLLKFNCSDNAHILFGKHNNGTFDDYFTISGSTLTHYSNNSPTTKNIGFTLNTNEDYLLIYTVHTDTIKRLEFEIYGQFNEYYKYSKDDVSTFGYPTIKSNSNECIIKEFSMSVSSFYDVKNAKVAVIGHSYVEGNSLEQDRIYSFTSLLGNALGEDKVINYGLGGGTTQGLTNKISYCLKMSQNVEYVMIVTGCNDADKSKTVGYIIDAINKLPINIKPIIHTIIPRSTGFNSEWRDINNWIRNSGWLYVDAEQAFLDCPYSTATNSNIRQDLYMGDHIHPTIQGHLEIFRRIQMDCPFLF